MGAPMATSNSPACGQSPPMADGQTMTIRRSLAMRVAAFLESVTLALELQHRAAMHQSVQNGSGVAGSKRRENASAVDPGGAALRANVF